MKRGLHIDINSLFPDFFLTFWWIQKFPDISKCMDFSLNFLHYNFVLTFSWPVGTLQCLSIIKGVQWPGLWGARRLGPQVTAKHFLQNLKKITLLIAVCLINFKTCWPEALRNFCLTSHWKLSMVPHGNLYNISQFLWANRTHGAVLQKKWNLGWPNAPPPPPPWFMGWVVGWSVSVLSGLSINNLLRSWNQWTNWSKWVNWNPFRHKHKQPYWWFSARLQCHLCVSDGDTAIFH